MAPRKRTREAASSDTENNETTHRARKTATNTKDSSAAVPRLSIKVTLRSSSKAKENDPPGTIHVADDYSMLEDDGDDGAEITSDDDEFVGFRWLEQVDGIIKRNGSAIGGCNAKLIRKNFIRKHFYTEMEMPTQETATLAFELFDRFGRLKQCYRNHPRMKGSWIWQSEFDDCSILLFEAIGVDRDHRRNGYATRLLEAVLEKIRPKSRCFLVIASCRAFNKDIHALVGEPSAINGRLYRDRRHEALGRAEEDNSRFWRSQGFRRIGSSPWFAYTSDPNHPSRSLSIAADFDVPQVKDHGSLIRLEDLLEDDLPSKFTDGEFLAKIKARYHDLLPNDSQWLAVDRNGNTLLHRAVEGFMPESIRWLLQNHEGLRNVQNEDGQTALDAIEIRLDEVRTQRPRLLRIDHVSHEFTGFTDEAIECILLLRDTLSPSHNEILRVKYGCTCGQCLGGFLSPHMRFMLLMAAECMHDMLDYPIGFGTGPSFVDWNDDILHFVPQRVRENMRTNKSLRQGFIAFIDCFARCLRLPGNTQTGVPAALPYAQHVLSLSDGQWPPVCRNYLERGGTISAVGSAIFQHASEVYDELIGDGNLSCGWDEGGDDPVQAEYRALQRCRNDHEYDFVGSLLGCPIVESLWFA